MGLFQQRTMIDGSMPYTHIAEVQAVSFTGPEVRIRLISVHPPVELPIYFLPEDGVQGDPLQSREIVEAYYHPAVPRDPFPPEYDPEIDQYPQVQCEYIAARYFQPAEKVLVIQDGQDFFVICTISMCADIILTSIGGEIASATWLTMMAGAVFTRRDTPGYYVGILTDDSGMYEIGGDEQINLPLHTMPYQNYNLVQTRTNNLPFPIFVFPREPLVHLDLGWTWAGGAYNYVYVYGDYNYDKSAGKRERFASPSVVFPGVTPDIRLEIQPLNDPGNSWSDQLPDLEFYATSSGLNFDGIKRDFINNDSHVEFIFSIARPWGTVESNPDEWRTSNWTPPILFCPDESQSNPPGATDLPKPAISFGFVDYKKTEYNGNRNKTSNEYRFVTGKIYAELKEASIGKPLLNKNDYNYTTSYDVGVKDSGYTVHINDTGTVIDASTTQYVRDVTINQPLDPLQTFETCVDGTNTLKKKPVLNFTDSRTVHVVNGTTQSLAISLSIEHYINSTLMFTSSFNTNADGTAWNQRLYYIYSLDLVNKLILAHVYIFDEPGSIQKVECVVIDSSGEYVIWSYDTSDSIGVTTPVNVPPWMLSDTFPSHPQETGYIGETGKYDHTEYVWKVSYFNGLSFPLDIDDDSECSLGSGAIAVPIGGYFPCTELDEDIRSIILFAMTHYDVSSTVQGYTQQKQHYTLYPRRSGWIAFMRCCFWPIEGVIAYPYGSDVIVKDNGVVSDGLWTVNGDAEQLNVHEAV